MSSPGRCLAQRGQPSKATRNCKERGSGVSIINLLNQIKTEKIVLPAIQRDFVWSEERTAKLLDSIMRGYPIGLVLLWETYRDIQYRTFIQDFKEANSYSFRDNHKQNQLKLVLDGQQRLQSLYVALYGTREGRRAYFDVLSGEPAGDFSEERFRFDFLAAGSAGSGTAAPSGPAALNGGAQGYFMRLDELVGLGPEERLQRVDEVTKERHLENAGVVRLKLNLDILNHVLSFDENVLKVSTIDENLPPGSTARKSEADVLEIFVRINREGERLSRSDLIFSMLKLNWKESAEDLPEFVRHLNSGNAFDLDEDFIIQCLFAVSDFGTKMDLNLLRKAGTVDKP